MISNSLNMSMNHNKKKDLFNPKSSVNKTDLRITPIKEVSEQDRSEKQSVKSFLFKNKQTTKSFQIDTSHNISTMISSDKNIKVLKTNPIKIPNSSNYLGKLKN